MPKITSEHIDYDRSILLRGVLIEPIPPTLEVGEVTLHRKEESHITLTNHLKLAERITGKPSPKLADELLALFKEYVAEHPIDQYEVSNDFYFVQSGSRKTVVAMAKVPALKGFFAKVRKKYGVDVPDQPPHVTLYTLLPDKIGIGVRSKEDLRKMGTKVKLDLRVAPNVLARTRFGNPILRQQARKLTKEEILSPAIQQLITDMRHSLQSDHFGKYGVGLAAQQVGVDVALSVISIKPTPRRPGIKKSFEQVIINPEVTETFGRRISLWEGCISGGRGSECLYAQVPRYKKIKLRYLDEDGEEREEILEGLTAHVAQHETDHTNGILFVDRVKDTRSYMLANEYRRRVAKVGKNAQGK